MGSGHMAAFLTYGHTDGQKFFTISPQYNNSNFANFILAVQFKIKRPIKSATMKGNPVDVYFHIC